MEKKADADKPAKDKYRYAAITFTMKKDDAIRISELAREAGMTRSKFIVRSILGLRINSESKQAFTLGRIAEWMRQKHGADVHDFIQNPAGAMAKYFCEEDIQDEFFLAMMKEISPEFLREIPIGETEKAQFWLGICHEKKDKKHQQCIRIKQKKVSSTKMSEEAKRIKNSSLSE